MGGNLVLKLAGSSARRRQTELRAVVGVSPALDLGPPPMPCTCRSTASTSAHFCARCSHAFPPKGHAVSACVYDPSRADGIRSLRDFDERITALYGGFAGAEDYYYRAAAARVLDRIAVPTLILHALDDPFVRIAGDAARGLRRIPTSRWLRPRTAAIARFWAGLCRRTRGYWAESTLLRFLPGSAHYRALR